MDVVIPLGTGSRWDDNELRYALRSLEMHMPNIGNVYVIGHRPKWANKNLKCVNVVDTPGIENKERNIYAKILFACGLPEITDDFLFMNDDHYLLEKFDGEYYWEKSLINTFENRTARDHYYYSLTNTYSALVKAGRKTINYDIHCPIIYNKQDFILAMASYDWKIAYGYVVKSLYANTLRIVGDHYPDLKINSRMSCNDLDKLIQGRKFFSIGDEAVNVDLGIYLQYLYPNKSRFEL